MPYVNQSGIRINYEVHGVGAPLVLQHGVTSDLTSWVDYIDPLRNDFRLILVDARGHGRSDKPQSDEDYRLETMAKDIVTVLDHLELKKANYVGYSMGGLIGYALGRDFPSRLNTLIIGGASSKPPSGAYKKSLEGLRDGLRIGESSGARAYLDHMISLFGTVNEDYQNKLLARSKSDFQAYIHVVNNLLSQNSDFTDSFRALDIPKMIYVGELDEFVAEFANECHLLFPSAKTCITKGKRHILAEHTETFIDAIRAFLLNSNE